MSALLRLPRRLMTLSARPLLVVALEQALAGPICTSRLVDAGARVIKIERPEGDFARHYDRMVVCLDVSFFLPTFVLALSLRKEQWPCLQGGDSTYFTWVNRGKESLVADIKAPQDLQLLRKILKEADVFVQNLAPGATTRAGLDSDELRKVNKRLITMDISGYGESGPKANYKVWGFFPPKRSPSTNFSDPAPGIRPVGASRERTGVCDGCTGPPNPRRCVRVRCHLRPQRARGHPSSPCRP
jgi:itaconate CoA-transferase